MLISTLHSINRQRINSTGDNNHAGLMLIHQSCISKALSICHYNTSVTPISSKLNGSRVTAPASTLYPHYAGEKKKKGFHSITRLSCPLHSAELIMYLQYMHMCVGVCMHARECAIKPLILLKARHA